MYEALTNAESQSVERLKCSSLAMEEPGKGSSAPQWTAEFGGCFFLGDKRLEGLNSNAGQNISHLQLNPGGQTMTLPVQWTGRKAIS